MLYDTTFGEATTLTIRHHVEQLKCLLSSLFIAETIEECVV
jgi:hypothetical protein